MELLNDATKSPELAGQLCVQLLARVLQPRCFLAMRLTTHPVPNVYGIICDVLKKKGYSPIRVDQKSFTGSVVEAIWTAIRGADIMIADLAGDSLNVYYELGIGHALGKHTVILAYSEDGQVPRDVPFDIRDRRILPYETEGALRSQLVRHLPDSTTRGTKQNTSVAGALSTS